VSETVRDDPAAGRFELLVDGTVAGFVTYRPEGDALALVHTEVDDAYEGQGIGSRLVGSVLDQLADREVAVLPYCPFIQDYLRKHPDRQDLVPEPDRARFGLT